MSKGIQAFFARAGEYLSAGLSKEALGSIVFVTGNESAGKMLKP